MKRPSIKPPILLKIVLDILLLLIIIITGFYIIFAIIVHSHTEETIPFAVHPNFYDKLHSEFYFSLPAFLGQILFIYTIIKFKQLVSLFFKGEIFSIKQVKITGIIGKLIIVVALLNTIPFFIYKHFIEETPRTVNYDFAGVNSFWFLLAIGLFFIFLSKIFDNARIIKEENELTV